ncbi:MAG: sugar ABC transporter ATP-binding protein [Defluviitaleaceae bacterium]|nr:sugar ABC transporter ATP-binding protein [Defluviitaleaceae bacterium]
MKNALMKLDVLTKSYGPTKAVQGVSMELFRGEVRALIGENGSGKSTLMAMMTGAVKPDDGKMIYKEKPFAPKSIIEASYSGISILVQELGTINGLTVAENIFLGKESYFAKFGLVSEKKMNTAAEGILKELNIDNIKASQPVDELSFEDRKLVEICRAMYADPEILIVDETTTALSHRGRDKIYAIIQNMKERGKAVVFISHDLEEVQRVCNSATILRDGKYIDTIYGEDLTPEKMRELMIGRDFEGAYYRSENSNYASDEIVLRVEDVSYKNILKNISFTLRRGEILGFGGLTECGMHELCKIIFGAIKPDSGKITLGKTGVELRTPSISIKNGVAYLPKDRDQESLFLATSIKDNIAVASLDNIKKGPFITRNSEKKIAEKVAEDLSIKMQSINQLTKELSGGNKQKVALSKWFANDSSILIMDCPTRGIDIGVKAAIYSLMEQLIKSGKSIIMVSEEMLELLGMSDRILIIKNGEINGQFNQSDNVTESMLIEKII